MANKVIYAMFDDDHTLLDGAKSLVSQGVKIRDVFSPFPVHGLDPVIGVQHTRLGICAFLYGLTGLAVILYLIFFMQISDWPANIGGKPNMSFYMNLPAFIPVTFEFTVLCAAHGMAITYLLRNRTLPGMPPSNPDPRTSDDMFVMEVYPDDNSVFDNEELQGMLREVGAIEINEKEL